MKIGVVFDGLDELDAQLAQLGTKAATDIAERSVAAGADVLVDGWRKAAPYHSGTTEQNRRYGHLRDNIRKVVVKSAKVTYIAYDVTTGHAFWGKFLELGTRFMRAHPWARPALDRLRGAIVKAQVDGANEGIADALAGKTRAKR